MIMNVLLSFADRLVEFMGIMLVAALVLRWIAYKAAQRDQIYFKTFARGIEKVLETQDKHQEVRNVDEWLSELLRRVLALLPERSLRAGRDMSAAPQPSPSAAGAPGPSFRFQMGQKESLEEFAEGKKSIVHAVRHQVDVFKSPYPPNFSELTYRVLSEDRQWKQVIGIPMDMFVRMMDVLPGIFVVFGIFGTFIGIAAALPKVGEIDMSKLNEATPVLKAFIDSISLSMRCSIAGIFCSIFTTVLNAMYPIYASRAEVRRNLERCFEMMWFRIHGDKVSYADGRMIQLLEKLVAAWGGSPSDAKIKNAG